MEKGLYETLTGYCNMDILPMHMPGHKRNPVFEMENPYRIDVTEVTGLDYLHQPEGVIRRLMDRVTSVYGSDQSYFLINGSTGGILSAITSCCRHGDRIVVARNCHKSVYHAIRLLKLRPIYIYPSEEGGEMEHLGIAGIIQAEAVEQALQAYEGVSCVILTSPTYEGIVSRIRDIAAVTARYDVPLIVDEAHGAHFQWHSSFPDTALQEGADLVIESLHKTLPSLTQTGILHARFDRVSKGKLEWALQTYQSSSPSYVLMAGIERCFAYIEQEGVEAFDAYVDNLRWFEKEMGQLQRLYLFHSPQKERSKLVIAADRAGMTGRELAERLYRQYQIETEMSGGHYCIAMTSVCDETESFRRLAAALREIDAGAAGPTGGEGDALRRREPDIRLVWRAPERGMYSDEAAECRSKWIPLEKAACYLAAEDISFYPPGIPLLVQGERFSLELIRVLQYGIQMGYVIHGVRDGRVSIVCEEEGFVHE